VNNDRVKGTIDEVVGSSKRKAGKWTGNTPLQVKGMAQQVKGKLEKTLGKAKDAVRESRFAAANAPAGHGDKVDS
jgi:uncharacterized protein YjbJ (UPF0337 family)